MVIPNTAIKEFLDAPRDDHRDLKNWNDHQIDWALAGLDPPLASDNYLHLHQRVCIYLGIKYPRFAFWVNMGGGKTLITLELLRYWWRVGAFRRALILVTSDKAFPTWERQLHQWGIDLPAVTLDAPSSEAKWQQLARANDGLILATYPGLRSMVTVREKNAKTGKSQDVLDDMLVQRLVQRLDALVLDESTKAGHRSSLTSKLCRRLSKDVQICYALAGRPFGRDPTLMWAQFMAIDGGATLGPTIGLFHAAFCTEEKNRWSRNRHAKNYHFHKPMMPQLSQMIQHRSITYTAKECVDLPRMVPVVEEVILPEEAEGYYKRCVDEIIAAKGNRIAVKNVFLRMRQLSSGFLGFKDDETGERAEVVFAENPKLDRLMELLEELADAQAVVFYDFTLSARSIIARCQELELSTIWLWSGTKDVRAELKRFMDGEAQIALIQNRVGAYSLDGLQEVANYSFFFESPVSGLDREQAEARVCRPGQLKTVFQYDLIVRDTMDGKIRFFHKEGRDLMRALVDAPQQLVGPDAA